MTGKQTISRSVVIAVVLFAASFAALQFVDWACAQSDPALTGTDDPIDTCRIDILIVIGVASVPFLVTFPAWPLEQWLDAPWDVELHLLSAIGAVVWGVVLAAGWALLDRYRRRDPGDTLGP